MKRKLKNIFCTEKPNNIEILIANLLFFLFFATMYYPDNLTIFENHFYINCKFFSGESVDILGIMSLPYGLIHQWLCEIWVLPINLLHYAIGLSATGIAAILWYKFCIVLFWGLCIREMWHMAKTLDIKEKQIQWMMFLFVTSILVVLPVFHIAQTDSMYLLFMLMGVHSLLKGDTKKFLLCFTISISFKMISLFAFIPLILLSEKRIFYVLRNFLLGCIVIPFQQIWYRIVALLNKMLFSERGAEAIIDAVPSVEAGAQSRGRFYSKIVQKALYFEFPAVAKEYTASLFIFLFALLCIWCYMQKKEEKKEWQQKCIYAVMMSLAVLFLMITPAPYWVLILYPFLFLLIYISPERLRFNFILETGFSLCMFLVFVMRAYWVYGGAQSFDLLFLTKWGIMPSGHEYMGGPNVAGYLQKVGVVEMMPIVTAICLACIIGIAWINYPTFKFHEEISEENILELHHVFAMFNLLVLAIWYVINIILIGRY